jgi:hypothetical protein
MLTLISGARTLSNHLSLDIEYGFTSFDLQLMVADAVPCDRGLKQKW